MAADHSARGSMKTGVKPETVCELQDTNDHRQVERKWRLPISVGKLSALEGRFDESIHTSGVIWQWTFVVYSWRRLKSLIHGSALLVRACPDMKCAFNGVHDFNFDLGGAGSRTELKHIIKCRKRNQMGFP